MEAKEYSGMTSPGKATPEEIKRRNLSIYGAKIKSFRIRAHLSAEQLAERLHISKSSVRNWECGLTRPDPDYLLRMFTLLNVEPNEFFGIQGVGSLLTAREQALVASYRQLDEAGREDMEAFAEAMAGKARSRQLRAAKERMTSVADWGRYAAAGDGAEWPEHPECSQVILYASAIVNRADEIITVTGNSMAPQYHHGDRVLVEHCESLRNGDIGIFYVPGYGGVIKQKAYDRLHSINPAFDDIFPYEDGATVIGRVLGRIENAMIPSDEQRTLFLEATGNAK